MKTSVSIFQGSAVKTIIALFIGAIITIGIGTAMYLSNKADSKKVYIETEAVIENIIEEYDSADEEYEYTVYVKYVVDGKQYSNIQYPGYSSSMKIGDTVTVEYNRDNPSELRNEIPSFIAYVLFGIGGLCLLGVLFIFILAFANRGKKSDFEAAINQGAIEEVKR
ncbi:MAG: DUF3592 domain-containing protein [Clostridia bacterium]|nr:DUF3592 domain-containing protein [Clostridia bacterium]